jgi:4-amino-4-deoxy-L-arabinose transferase-like glycosyltransferase
MLKGHKTIWWIMGLALTLRLAIIPALGSDPENCKPFEYGHIAMNIVNGLGFQYDFDGNWPLQYTAYGPALYCYFLVPWFWLFGFNLLGPRLMHAVMLAAVGWFLYRIGERLVNRRVGLIAAGLWAVYPELIFLSLRLAPENTMFLPMMAMLWMALQLERLGSRWYVLAVGILLGISCWIDSSLQMLAPILVGCWWLNGKLRGREGVRRVGLLVAGFFLVVTPWTVRNYIRLGAIVPLRSSFAYNMWRGNHPGATGTVRTLEGKNVDEVLTPDYNNYIQSHLDPLHEVTRDRFFAAEVKRFIRENPGEYFRLSWQRLEYYWWLDPTHPLTKSLFYTGPWIMLLAAAAVGIGTVRKAWRLWSLFGLQILGFSILFGLTVVVPRYRLPIYPAMLLLAAAGVELMLRTLQEKYAFNINRG